MINKKYLRNIIFAALSGILSTLAFPPFELTLLGWISIVPLLVILSEAGTKRGFLWGAISGAVFFGSTLYWLSNVTIPGMILLVTVLSVFYGIFGICAKYVFKRSIDLLALPIVWVVLEYARGRVLTGFPWASLGYSQYENLSIIQIADITGVYGVSFIMIVFNVAVFAFIKRIPQRVRYLAATLFLLMMVTAYGTYRLNNLAADSSLTLSIVQGNIPQEEKWDPNFNERILEKYISLTEIVSEQETKMIIWPETAYPYLMENNEDSASEFKDLSERLKTPLLIGAVYSENGYYFNSALLFDSTDEEVQVYHKTHLVPFGEYIPFKEYLSFFRDVIDKPIGDFLKGKGHAPLSLKAVTSDASGTGIRTRETKFYKFGTLICFEDIFPYISRELVKNGADFLINMTNDAWFKETAAARQHLQSSVFRAVENRCPLVRAANTGISCFISAKGKIYSVVGEGGREIFISGSKTDKIEIYSVRSYYSAYGDIFVFFCVFMVFFIFIGDRITLSRRDQNT
ncbi:MAG: apolipoprotein N-acyltransferase [Candidatus Omnitrophota bacterium]